MRKAKKLYILLGVLLAVCLAAFGVSQYEEKKEQIKNSGELILELPTDSVTALSWEYDGKSLSFTREENGWCYDEDAAFPVDEEKINELLEPFTALSAAFVIEEVEDYGQYGLDSPECTICLTAEETEYTIALGDFSQMDEQRYVSLGDGKAYLAVSDPLETYDVELSDLICNDTLPELEYVSKITFAGVENYSIDYREDGKSICAGDVYFIEENPLDTDNVEDYLNSLETLSLATYVTYNATETELKGFGFEEPDITITVEYRTEESSTETETMTVQIARNPSELAEYQAAVENEEDTLPSVTCYARINGSQIIYKTTQTKYNTLTDVSYDSMRHQTLFSGNFDTVKAMDVTLDGETVSFLLEENEEEDADAVWKYGDAEIDISQLKSELLSVKASEFSQDAADGQEEIALTLYLDNEDFPAFTLKLYRYDGDSCRATIDDVPIGLVSRSQTVDLIEAAREIILNAKAE